MVQVNWDNKGILWATLWQQIYNLDEMDQFFGEHKLPKLKQGEKDHLNRFISIKDF